MQIAATHYSWLKFIQYGKFVVCFCWLAITALLYWHAPTIQVEQLYDCRWNLAYILFSAILGNVWLNSPSTLLYTATYISTLYSVVYCFLALVIYGTDTILILLRPDTETVDLTGYVRLSISMVVLSCFGLSMSIFHFYCLLKVGWEQESKKQIIEHRRIQVFSVMHSTLAFFTMYIAVELSPVKTWFLRSYVVREFACSLLTLSLAVVQILSFFFLNSYIIKVLIFLNLCQAIQEVQMGIYSFYTSFFVKQLSSIINVESLLYHQILVSMGVMAHLYRLTLCIWTIYLLAPYVFQKALTLRVVRTVDPTRLNANTQLDSMERQDNRWLIFLAIASLAIAVGHIFVVFVNIFFGLISEELLTSTGISFVLAMLLFCSISWYRKCRYRMAMITSLYFSLNLIVMSLLFVLNFLHERFFGSIIPPHDNDSYLYVMDLALAAATFWVSVLVVRFGFRLILETTVLHAQPHKVSFWVAFLRWIAMFTLCAAAIQFVLFLAIHLNSEHAHLASLTSSIQDWFLLAAQGVLLYWACKHERYQALIALLVFELTTIAVTSLDLLSQQTDLIQMMITLLFKTDQTLNLNSDAKLFHPSQYFVVLIVHFVQILQWFLSVFALGICLYIADNMVVDELSNSNDVHEITPISNDHSTLLRSDNANSNTIAWSSTISPEVQISFENTVFQPEFNDPIAIHNLPQYND